MKKEDENQVRQLVSYNLKRYRLQQNASQLSLSLNAGLTHNFINDIENCKKGISAKTIAKLCGALRIEPYQLFLPENRSDEKAQAYISDFTDSIQKTVRDLSAKYFPQS